MWVACLQGPCHSVVTAGERWGVGPEYSVLYVSSPDDGREGGGLPDVSWLPVYAHVFYGYLVLTEARGVLLESVCSAYALTASPTPRQVALVSSREPIYAGPFVLAKR